MGNAVEAVETVDAVDAVNPVAEAGILAPSLRALTIGMLGLVSILAFEQLAVATVMPVVAQALGGMTLYAAAFGVAMAAGIFGMALAGPWTDRAGPRPALWAGIAAFVLGVLGVGVALDMPQLVAGRALQGFGGGLMSVALYVVVAQAYPPGLHPRIFSAFAAAWVLPAIVGPVLAGLIARHLGWRWVFLAAALLAVPAALLLRQGLQRLPQRPRQNDAGRLPLPDSAARSRLWWAAGTALSAGLLYAGGKAQGPGGLLMACALLGIACWAPRLLPRGTLAGRPGLPAVIALRGLAAAAFFAGEVLIPLLLVSERGASAVEAGLVLMVGALGWSAGSWFQGRGTHTGNDDARVRVLQLGMAAIGLGVLAVTVVLLPAVPIAVAGLAWAVAGVGMGLVYPTLSVLTLECAPVAEQGAASAALQLSDSLFSAVGLALASAALAALLAWSSGGAYLAGFGLAAALALAGVALARRARPQARG